MAATLGGQVHTGGLVREMGIWSGSTVYDVFADPTDMEGAILAVTPFVEGSYYPDPVLAAVGVRCRAVRPDRDGRGQLGKWTLTLDWSNAPISEEEQERITNPNPVDRKAVIDVVVSREDKPRGKNRDGSVQQNSARERIDPPLKDIRLRYSFRVRKNFELVPPWLAALGNKVNSDPVFIGQHIQTTFPPRTLLFLPDGASGQGTDNNQPYCETQFLLEYKEEGWDEEVLDVGFYYYPGGVGVGGISSKVPFRDKDGEDLKTPQYLDGNGDKSTDGAHFFDSEYKEEASFSDLAGVLA